MHLFNRARPGDRGAISRMNDRLRMLRVGGFVSLLLFGPVSLTWGVGPVDFVAPPSGGAEAIIGNFEDGVWSEGRFDFPPPPITENLIAIDAGPAATNRFFVDELSVAVGADGVIRYTLIALSPGGAKNVSHEGMRCQTGERRLYAIGRADGSWAKARNDKWGKISPSMLHHAALYRDYFCTIGGSVGDTDAARRVLPKGNPAAVLPY